MSPSILDAVSDDLAPIARAAAIQTAAARVGFDWPHTSAMIGKIEEESRELRDACAHGDRGGLAEEIGDLLLVLINLARAEGLDAEACLGKACEKFERRFRALEDDLRTRGKAFETESASSLDAIWKKVKEREERP